MTKSPPYLTRGTFIPAPIATFNTNHQNKPINSLDYSRSTKKGLNQVIKPLTDKQILIQKLQKKNQ